MKRSVHKIICCCVIALSWVGQVCAEDIRTSANLVKNGTFDSDLFNWKTYSSISGQVADAEITYEYSVVEGKVREPASDANSQKGLLHIHAMKTEPTDYIQELIARQCVAIGDAQLFDVEAKFKYDALPSEPGAHRINLIWYEDEHCKDAGQFGDYVEPELREGWQHLGKQNIKSALNAHSVMVEINQKVQLSVRKLGFFQRIYHWILNLVGASTEPLMASGYWDDIALYAHKTSSKTPQNEFTAVPEKINGNYVLNPSFDYDRQYWHAGNEVDWTNEVGRNSPGALRTHLHSDTGSMGTGVMRQCVNVDAHTTLTAGASVMLDKRSNQTGNVRLRVVWSEFNNCEGRSKIDSLWADMTPVGQWQSLTIAGLQPPENAQSLTLEVIQAIAGKGDFSVYWDDVYLKESGQQFTGKSVFD